MTAGKPYRIQLLNTSSGVPHEMSGQYIVSYDPDFHWPDGSYDGGLLECTPDPEKAAHFATLEDALHLWRSGPRCDCHRLRLDGQPNRPLTAFDASISSISPVPPALERSAL